MEWIKAEWLGGFVAGVLATLIGFLLTVVWDIIKYYRDRTAKDNAVLFLASQEMEGHIEVLRGISDFLKAELEVLQDQKMLIYTISPLYSFAWELLALNIPKRLVKDKSLFERIRRCMQSVVHINEIIRSRENYRTNSTGMNNYMDRIKAYDQLLLDESNHLISALEETGKLL